VRFWFILLVPILFGLLKLAEAYPEATEKLYSRGVYPALAQSLGRVAGAVPFSIVEILIYIAIIAVVSYLTVQTVRLVRGRDDRRDRACRMIATVVCVGSLWYAVSSAMYAFNYHRLSFQEHSGLFVRESSAEELAALCSELVITANTLREDLPEDGSGVMASGFASPYEQAVYAGTIYEGLAAEYPALGGYTPRPKPVLASPAMSYMDIVGVFVPFTYECNVNTDVTAYIVPSAMAHELCHFHGFMREDEANFIAWLACSRSDNPEFAYSGAMLALIHATNSLHGANGEYYTEVMSPLSDKVKTDLAANNAYWREFEGPVATVSTAVNDAYLRANSQADGVKSYGRMVDLLLAEYRQRHGIS
jgi:hypothetical protein